MALVISRFEICLVSLNRSQAHEIRTTRSCVVISPNEMNHHIGTVIVAPMTTKGRDYPIRIPLTSNERWGKLFLIISAP